MNMLEMPEVLDEPIKTVAIIGAGASGKSLEASFQLHLIFAECSTFLLLMI